MRTVSEKLFILFFLIALALGIYRIWGYTVYEVPYGYDPGFFRYAIQSAIDTLPNLPGKSDPSLPYHEPLFPLLTVLLTFIGYTPDQIVGPFLGFLSIFTAFSLYAFGKQTWNRSLGLVAASIFLISIVQYQEFWWNYWRNIVGIIFIITSLTFLHKKSPLLIISIAGLFTMHRPSALYFAILLVLLLLVDIIKNKRIPWRTISHIALGSLIALPLYARELEVLTSMVAPLTTTFGGTTSSGTFFTSREFLILIFPYFLVLIPAIYRKFDKREYDSIFVGFLLGLVWSVGRLFFYNRMFVFFDIFAILMAAYAIVYIWSELPRRLSTMIYVIFFAVQGYLYTTHVHAFQSRHTISQEEFDIVENLDILVPTDSTILTTHKFYTPWVLGYSQMRTLAPGLLQDQIWDELTWNKFYFQSTPEEKCQMIQNYKPIAPKLYVFVGDLQPALDLPSTCFRPILSNLSHPIVYEVRY